jgi:hypothetical protein
VGTGEARLRPSSETRGVPSDGWPGSTEPYKPPNGEMGESGAGVGAVHSTVEAVAAEPRKREGAVLGLWVSFKVSAGECPTG